MNVDGNAYREETDADNDHAAKGTDPPAGNGHSM